jgi:hypothetical protein
VPEHPFDPNYVSGVEHDWDHGLRLRATNRIGETCIYTGEEEALPEEEEE